MFLSSHNFPLVSPINPVDINMWNDDVDPAGYDLGFGSSTTNNFQYGEFSYDASFDTSSQYEYSNASSYSQSAAPSEYGDYSRTRRPKPAHYSSNGTKASRRESSQSVPQSQYPDSSYFTNTMSPSMGVPDFSYYPTPGQEYCQDFAAYELSKTDDVLVLAASDTSSSTEPSIPASPNAHSDNETSSSSTDSTPPARNHPLYNTMPHDDGLYYCPFAETDQCGHEPKQLKCEYE